MHIYICISIHKVCFGAGAFRMRLGPSLLAWPREMPLFAAYGRSSLARSRRWLEMAARARPGAADGSKWPLEPAPEPQNTRRVPLEPALEPQNARRAPLEPPRNRRMLDRCRSSLPWSRRMLDGGRSSLPWSRRACSKSAARAHSRDVRSFLAFDHEHPKPAN